MATIDASIPLQIQKPDTFGKMSQLIGIQQQQTGLAREKTQLASEQQSLKQRQQLASFDVSKIIGEDGTIDLNKIWDSGLREAAGDQFPEILQQYASAKQQQLAAKQSLVQLTDAQRNSFGEMMGALRSDPDVAQDNDAGRQKLAQAFGQYAQLYGKDVEGVLQAYAGPLAKVPQGKLAQAIQNIQLQATSASDQASRQAPAYQNTGSELRNVNPYAQQGQGADRIPLTISPGEQNYQFTDQLGNVFVGTKDAQGNITGVRPMGGSGGAAVPGGPAAFGPGERRALEQQADTNFANINANRIAAQLAPQQLDQINKALDLSASLSTGGGDFASKRAKWESAIASVIPGMTAAGDDAAKLQLLDKFAERIAADSARVLGANASTDAARESIHRQNANIGYGQKAVQEVLKYAKAQTMAMSAKGDAQEKWLKAEGNTITKAHEFETAWRQAYDPVIYQLEAADPSERRAIIEKLPKAEAASLAEKRKKLREMGALK